MPSTNSSTIDEHRCPRPPDKLSWLTWTTMGALILAGLFMVSRYNFLLFHGLAELFSIAVAWSLFMLVWNTRQVNENGALIFIGIAFFFIGLVDLLHTLAYKGMGVFDDQWGANLPTQLWILGRYMQCAALIAFPLLLGRSVHLPAVLAGWASVTAVGLGSIFVWPVFPDCFVDGSGLTLFKVCSEYAICVLLLVALALLYRHRRKIDPTVGMLMAFSILTTIASELAFTFYVSVYGLSNLAGHFLKIIAFALIYLSLVRSGLTQPYSVLFNSLTESEARYRSFVSANLMGIWWLRIDPPMPTDIPADDQVTWLHRHAAIEESNDCCAQMLGFDSAADLIGMRVVDLMDGNEPSALEFLRVLVAEKGFLSNAELPMESQSKKRLWLLLSTFSLLNDGRLTRLWGSQVDITSRKRQEAVNAARLRLVASAGSHSVQQLLQKFLDETEVLTESGIGFFHFLEADQKTLSLQAWSTNTLNNMCTAEGAGQHYPVAEAGVWTDCIGAGQPVIHNDYPNLPHKKGLPEGHAPVSRELVVPVTRGGKIVAILGVGNKATDYDDEDVTIVKSLADAAWETVVRRQAEEALIEARDDLEHQVDARTKELAATIAELESLFNNSRVGMMVLSAGRIMGRGNQRLADILGYASPDEMRGLSMQALHLTDDGFHEFGQKYYFPLKKGEVLQVEYELKRQDGSSVWCSLSGKALDPASPPDLDKGVLWIVDDISDRVAAEEALLASQRKYADLYENAPDMYASVDTTSALIVECNQTLLNNLGYRKEELLGKPIFDLYHPACLPQARQAFETYASKGEVRNVELQLQRKDGTRIDVMLNVTAIRNDAGNIVQSRSAWRDITALKAAQEALSVSELRYIGVVNAMYEGMVLQDASGAIIGCNPAAEEILGRSLAQLNDASTLGADGPAGRNEGHPFAGDIHPATLALTHGEPVRNVKMRVDKPNGEETWINLSAQPILENETGEVLSVVTTFADITELVTAGEELKRSNRELEQFAYVASHDLQEPLRAIVGFLQLLESRYQDQLDEKARHYIERSVFAGQRMQTLITDLLTLSRVSTRGAPFETVGLNTIFSTAFDNLQVSIERHRAVVNCAQLPTLLADPNQMLSLFQNLILNGLKYNENRTPSIDIGCIENKNAYRFFIKDNGIGIAPEFHQRIFGLFQRLHTRSEYSGTGLGLALCKRIVERHSGRIWVESQPGEGATFYFELMKIGVPDGE